MGAGMDLEAVYFVSQVVAAFAIVGSLIFVGLQTRAATSQAKRNEAARRNAAADAVHRDFGKYYERTVGCIDTFRH